MLSFYFFSQKRGFCFFTVRFSFGVRTELALVGAERARSLRRQPAAAGDRPGLLAVGLHTSEDTQYVFQNFPPSLVVPPLPQTLRPSGPWRRACEVPSFSHPGQLSSLSEKPPGNSASAGWGGSQNPSPKSLGSRVGLPPASHTAATEETFETGSPGTAAPAAAALEVYFRHAAAPSAFGPQPRLHPASPAPVWVFPAQIHSPVRPKPGPPRRKIS